MNQESSNPAEVRPRPKEVADDQNPAPMTKVQPNVQAEDAAGADAFDISVVIPVLNGADTLSEQLEALACQTFPGRWELVVADNGSVDGTPDIVRSWSGRLPKVRIVDASARRGVNFARNVGARAARGQLLAFCDADDVASPGWLSALADGAERADLVCGNIDQKSLNDGRQHRWRDVDVPGRLPTALGFLPFAVGCNFAIRAAVLADVGGFDESYSRGGDDVDLSWRVQLAGHHLVWSSEAVMLVRHRGDTKGLAKQMYGYGRAEPQLYRAYRAHGAPRRPLRRAMRPWAWSVLHVGHLFRGDERRGQWIRVAAKSWGRLAGCVRYRVFCP